MVPRAVPAALSGGAVGLAADPSVRGDASLESFNSYRKRDRVNEWQREPGDRGGGRGGGWEGGYNICVFVVEMART